MLEPYPTPSYLQMKLKSKFYLQITTINNVQNNTSEGYEQESNKRGWSVVT